MRSEAVSIAPNTAAGRPAQSAMTLSRDRTSAEELSYKLFDGQRYKQAIALRKSTINQVFELGILKQQALD